MTSESPWTWIFHRRCIGPFGSDGSDEDSRAAPPTSVGRGQRRGDGGRHWTDSFAECVGVVRALEALHKRHAVHGNVRAFNVVFGGGGGATAGSHLIDFDFGGTVNRADYGDGAGTVPTYPPGYEPALRDGRRSGEAGRPVTVYDDWYALHMVLTHFHEIVPRAPCAIHADALDATISELESQCDIDPPDGCFKKLSKLKRNIAELEDCGGGMSSGEELTQKGGGGIEGVAAAAVDLLEAAEARGCRIAPERVFRNYLRSAGLYPGHDDESEGEAGEARRCRER
jgi:hypothetical protein